MKISTKNIFFKSRKATLVIISMIISLILIFSGMYFFKVGIFNETNRAETQKPSSISNSSDNKKPNDQKPDQTKVPQNIEPAPDSNSSSISASISYIQQDSNYLKIGTVINGVYSQGECRLYITKNNEVVSKTAGIQPLASSSTCKGFDIPIIELSPGNWTVEIEINIDSSKTKLTKTVTVK